MKKQELQKENIRRIYKRRQKAHDELLACDIEIDKILHSQKDTPMGVSQWKEHGRKYGYWDYFKK